LYNLQRKKNSLRQSPTDSVIIISHFVAPHNTTLYYFLFYVRCQDTCLHVYGVATVHR